MPRFWITLDGHLSDGQSWASNTWLSFAAFGLVPTDLAALHIPNVGGPSFVPGPLPNSAGVFLPTLPDGYASYDVSDQITIGRCAVIAQQLLRRRAGALAVPPILEFCAAYPGSSWGFGPQYGRGNGLAPGGVSWTNQTAILNAIAALPPQNGILGAQFTSFGYTQGGGPVDTVVQKEADLASMYQAFDAYSLPTVIPKPLIGYLGQPAAVSEATDQNAFSASEVGTVPFCRTNAPNAGGPYSGRCFLTGPSYPYPFDNGLDDIHTGPYGTLRWGEIEGYSRHLVQDRGIPWTPLWLSLTTPITRSGQVLAIPLDRPSGPDFASGVLSFAAGDDPANGFVMAPNYGFAVKRSGVFLTITNVAISGMNILLTISETLNTGDQLEVSYCMYGPGDGTNGYHSGIWGNVVMRGPQSVLSPGATIDSWLAPIFETITA